MGYGNWIEERRFEFPADLVYETLTGVLTKLGHKIETWDGPPRGVTAYNAPSFSKLFDASVGGRVAASVKPSEDNTSTVTVESGPAYAPWMFGEGAHRRHVERILTALTQALGEPNK